MTDRKGILIAAVFTLLASAVGGSSRGYFTYQASLGAAREATAREEGREADRARGAARLLIEDLDEAQIYAATALEVDRTLPTDDGIGLELPREDAALLYACLTDAEWVAVKQTIGEVRNAARVVEGHNAQHGQSRRSGETPLSWEVAEILTRPPATLIPPNLPSLAWPAFPSRRATSLSDWQATPCASPRDGTRPGGPLWHC